MQAPIFSEPEILVYRFVLLNPGCVSEDIHEHVPFGEGTVRQATAALERSGAIMRFRGERGDRRGHPPFRHKALRGTEPIEVWHNSKAEANRHSAILSGAQPSRRVNLRKRAMSTAQVMSIKEWEALAINFDLWNNGGGEVIIAEHIASRTTRGDRIELTMADWPRLKAQADELRRQGRARMRVAKA